MTTLHIQDIVRKKSVASRYQPNSYRIFCEDIGNQSVPDDKKYSTQAPQLYTQPLILPAQAIEDRNKPHAGRAADFLRENAHTYNEPVNKVRTRNITNESEKRWWEWNTPAEDDPNWKNKKRSSSSSNFKTTNIIGADSKDREGYQTTYQKEHGYLKEMTRTESGNSMSRHSNNPNSAHARHGAFVMEQEYPKASVGIKSRPDANKGTSVWDAMHPGTDVIGNTPPKTQIYQKPPSGKPEVLQNQRRDPIGYFEDTKFGGEVLQNGDNHLNSYHPSWNQSDENLNQQDQYLRPNELLDNAMRY